MKLHGNPFAGDPRPELEEAWHKLFEGKAEREKKTQTKQKV